MRLLHTSDWHLGQHFMGKSRQAEHQALIDWVVRQAEQQAVDALLLVGDVFDSGAPPSYARALYSQLVVGLHRAGCALVVLGGNHDSVAVLEENRAMLHCLGATVIAAVDNDPTRSLLLLTDRSGQPGALLCATPFIRPRDVLLSQAGQSAEAKQLALQTAIPAALSAAAPARGGAARGAGSATAADCGHWPSDHGGCQRQRIGAGNLRRRAGGVSHQGISAGRLYRAGPHPSRPASGWAQPYSLQWRTDSPEL